MKKSLETNLIAETFSWARKNKTLHGRLHCSTEIVALRDRFALDALSEEGLSQQTKILEGISKYWHVSHLQLSNQRR